MMPDAANAKFGPEKTWNTPVNFEVGGSPIELYFSPSDGTTNAIREKVEVANADVEFALLALTRDDLGEAIVSIGQSFFVSPIGAIEQVNTTGSEFDYLVSNGIQVYHHSLSGDLHHKYCIIDHSEVGSDPMVITGSHNWSSTAENVNDENTVIVHDARVANLYHQEFRGIINAITGTPDGLDATETKSWTLMPNPAREQVWVRGLQAGDVVSLLDMGGREVSCEQVRASDVVQLNLGVLSAGLYHVAVTSNAGRVTTSLLAVQ
jgi:hypothetical protein